MCHWNEHQYRVSRQRNLSTVSLANNLSRPHKSNRLKVIKQTSNVRNNNMVEKYCLQAVNYLKTKLLVKMCALFRHPALKTRYFFSCLVINIKIQSCAEHCCSFNQRMIVQVPFKQRRYRLATFILKRKEEKNRKSCEELCLSCFALQWSLFTGSSPLVQLLASILFLVTIMALLICSKETNITTFHEPSLRNEGTNLRDEGRKTKFLRHLPLKTKWNHVCSREAELTLCRTPWAPLWSTWSRHSWWHSCTGPVVSSCTWSWPRRRARRSPWWRSRRRTQRQSGRAGCLRD